MAAPLASQGASADAVDCEGPASDARPGTPEWNERDAQNMFCAQQRHIDQAAHPLFGGSLVGPPFDTYREPSRHDGVRFRFRETTIAAAGEALAAEVYRPCAPGTCNQMPVSLETFDPPYPAVIVVHGGSSRKELHWWSSQPLAEAGYMVVAFDSSDLSPAEAEVLGVTDWLLATPDQPTAAGQHNPFWEELDGERLGVAGHSAGGVLASSIGHQDPRVSAIVSWDRAQSGPMPEDLALRTPALFLFADYNCQRVPVCQPHPYPDAPNPDGPGNKGEDFQRLREAGVDTMQIALRAATHLDWVPAPLSGNRYAEIVSVYYTVAWFDRYLKGAGDPAAAVDAFRRLTAFEFDGSADRHNISQGFYDPAQAGAAGDPYAGNVPYGIVGLPVADRLSFYFSSKCFITFPGGDGGRATSEDMRADGCSTGGRGGAARCKRREATITGVGGVLRGTPGPDVIRAGRRAERIRGRGGNDLICAARGSDVVLGGRGRDRILGGGGADDIRGGRRRDALAGQRGRDRLRGQRGGDRLLGGPGRDGLAGGPGRDRLRGGSGSDDVKQ